MSKVRQLKREIRMYEDLERHDRAQTERLRVALGIPETESAGPRASYWFGQGFNFWRYLGEVERLRAIEAAAAALVGEESASYSDDFDRLVEALKPYKRGK
jgi:hypothetical protein